MRVEDMIERQPRSRSISPEVSRSIPSTSSAPPPALTSASTTAIDRDANDDDDDDDDEELDDGADDEGALTSSAATKDDDGEDHASGSPSKRAIPPTNLSLKTQAAFVHKLYSMVSVGPTALRSLIGWSKDGRSFTVTQPNEFARIVLPQYFKHANFASFVRQLNMYGFHKVNDLLASAAQANGEGALAWEFQHVHFRRDEPDLLARIKRKSSKTSAASSPGPPRAGTPASAIPSRRGRTVVQDSTSKSIISDGVSSVNGGEGPDDGKGAGSRSNSPSATLSESGAATSMKGDDGVRKIGWRDVLAPAGERSYSGVPRPRRDCSPPTSFNPRPPSSGTTRLSPTSSLFPPLAPSPYPSPLNPPRPLTASDTDSVSLARQLSSLEAQVKALHDALAQSHHAAAAARSNANASMRVLLGVVEGFGLTREQKEQLERCSSLLLKADFEPALPPSGFPPPSLSWGPWQTSGPNATRRSSRPTSSSSSLFHYQQRPAAPESYARGGLPRRSESRDDLYPPPDSESLASYGRNGSGSSSSGAYSSTRPGSSGLGAFPPPSSLNRPGSSSATAYPGTFPSPRSSWPGSGDRTRSSDALPSLSSLLVGGGGGEARARPLREEGEGEGEETGRKKPRY